MAMVDSPISIFLSWKDNHGSEARFHCGAFENRSWDKQREMCVETRHEVTWKMSGIEPGPEMTFAYLTIIISKDNVTVPVLLFVHLFLVCWDSGESTVVNFCQRIHFLVLVFGFGIFEQVVQFECSSSM
jgi:hypothetical protein